MEQSMMMESYIKRAKKALDELGFKKVIDSIGKQIDVVDAVIKSLNEAVQKQESKEHLYNQIDIYLKSLEETETEFNQDFIETNKKLENIVNEHKKEIRKFDERLDKILIEENAQKIADGTTETLHLGDLSEDERKEFEAIQNLLSKGLSKKEILPEGTPYIEGEGGEEIEWVTPEVEREKEQKKLEQEIAGGVTKGLGALKFSNPFKVYGISEKVAGLKKMIRERHKEEIQELDELAEKMEQDKDNVLQRIKDVQKNGEEVKESLKKGDIKNTKEKLLGVKVVLDETKKAYEGFSRSFAEYMVAIVWSIPTVGVYGLYALAKATREELKKNTIKNLIKGIEKKEKQVESKVYDKKFKSNVEKLQIKVDEQVMKAPLRVPEQGEGPGI